MKKGISKKSGIFLLSAFCFFTGIVGCHLFCKNDIANTILDGEAPETVIKAFDIFDKQEAYRYEIKSDNASTQIATFNTPDLLYIENVTRKTRNYWKGYKSVHESSNGDIHLQPSIKPREETQPDGSIIRFGGVQSENQRLMAVMGRKGFDSMFITDHIKEFKKYINYSCYQGVSYVNNILCDVITITPERQSWAKLSDKDIEIVGFHPTIWIGKKNKSIQKIRYTYFYKNLPKANERTMLYKRVTEINLLPQDKNLKILFPKKVKKLLGI
ncbi:MAG: hypothetical protein KAI63_03785, partial [Planctomycetes bacterium]|nr:hypothetical protein [Planctomycetota bacterium]